jgi:hypothetical protein
MSLPIQGLREQKCSRPWRSTFWAAALCKLVRNVITSVSEERR